MIYAILLMGVLAFPDMDITQIRATFPDEYTQLSQSMSDPEIESLINYNDAYRNYYADHFGSLPSPTNNFSVSALGTGPTQPSLPDGFIVPIMQSPFEVKNVGPDGVYTREEKDVEIPLRDGFNLEVKRSYNSSYYRDQLLHLPVAGAALKYLGDREVSSNMLHDKNCLFLLKYLLKEPDSLFGMGWKSNLGGYLFRNYHTWDDGGGYLFTQGGDEISIKIPEGNYRFYAGEYKGHDMTLDNLVVGVVNYRNDSTGSFATLKKVVDGFELILENGVVYSFKKKYYSLTLNQFIQKSTGAYYGGTPVSTWIQYNTLVELYVLTERRNVNLDVVQYVYEATPPIADELVHLEDLFRSNSYRDLSNGSGSDFRLNASETYQQLRLSDIRDNYNRNIHLAYQSPLPIYQNYEELASASLQGQGENFLVKSVQYTGVNGSLQQINYSYDSHRNLTSVAYPSQRNETYDYGFSLLGYYLRGITTPEKLKMSISYGFHYPSANIIPPVNAQIMQIADPQGQFSLRHMRYIFTQLTLSDGGLVNPIVWTFKFKDPEVYSLSKVTPRYGDRLRGYLSTIYGDETYSFKTLSITEPIGTSQKQFSQGLLTSNINPLNWTTSQTWDFASRVLTKVENNRSGVKQTTEYPSHDVYNNPTLIKEYGTDANGNIVYKPEQRIKYLHETDTAIRDKNILSIPQVVEYYTMSSNTIWVDLASLFPPKPGSMYAAVMVPQTTFTSILTKKETTIFPVGSFYPARKELWTQSKTINTGYQYDSNGFLQSTTLPDGQTILYDYQAGTPYLAGTTYSDVNLRIDSRYDANTGLITQKGDFNKTLNMGYTDAGLLQSITYPDGYRDAMSYDFSNRQMTYTNRVGDLTTYAYDGLGRITSVVKPDETNTFQYDANNKITQHQITRGGKSRINNYAYDVLGRLTGATPADGNRVTIEYVDSAGKKVITDANNNSTTYVMNGLEQLSTVQKVNNGQTLQARYTFDSFGNPASVLDFGNNTTTYTYNPFGQLTKLVSPYKGTHTYTYNNNGNMTAEINGRGQTISYSGYDSLGNCGVVSGNSFLYNYTYHDPARNALNRLSQVRSSEGFATDYFYNFNGSVTKLQYTYPMSSYTLEYTYDPLFNLTGFKDVQSKMTNYSYDAYHRLTSVVREGKQVAAYYYNNEADDFGQPSAYAVGPWQMDLQYPNANSDYVSGIIHQGNAPLSVQYTFDAPGNRLTSTFSDKHHPIGMQTTYTYDNLYQLTNVNYAGQFGLQYQYNAAGNRTAYNYPGHSFVYGYLPQTYDSNLTVINNSSTLRKMEDAQYQVLITHDADGNVTNRSFLNKATQAIEKKETYRYDALNRMIESQVIAEGNTNGASSVYDDKGRRLALLKNNQIDTFYVWGQKNDIVAEVDGSLKIKKTFVNNLNGEKLAIVPAQGNVVYFINDPLGTPMKLINDSGNIVAEYQLDPFGQIRFNNATIASENIPPLLMNTDASFSGSPTATAYQVKNNFSASGVIAGNLSIKAGGTIRLLPGFHAKAGSEVKIGSTRSDVISNNYIFTGKEFDSILDQYYFGARFYDPLGGRWMAADPASPKPEEPFTYNSYMYCANNPLKYVDPDGRRTYLANGINNDRGSSVAPREVRDFANAVNSRLGREEVVVVPGIFNSGSGLNDFLAVGAEMANMGVYSDKVTEFIKQDLIAHPLAKGEKLNVAGYSGGGQVVFNIADKLKGTVKVDNLITLGSPTQELTRGNIENVYRFNSLKDMLSWPSMFDNSHQIHFQDVNHYGDKSWLNSPSVLDSFLNIVGGWL